MIVHYVVVRFVSATNYKPARLRCQTGDNKPKFFGYHSYNSNHHEMDAGWEYIRGLFPNHEIDLVSCGYGLNRDYILGFNVRGC